jgi:phosphate transport system permease protein
LDSTVEVGKVLTPNEGAGKPALSFFSYGFGDRLFKGMTAFFAAMVLLLALVTAGSLLMTSQASIKAFGWKFLVTSDWDPIQQIFGAVPFIYGTIVSSALSLLIAIPLGLGISLFLTELAPQRLREPVAFLVDILAAIPSVVYGLWGMFVLAPFMRVHVDPVLMKSSGLILGLAAGITVFTLVSIFSRKYLKGWTLFLVGLLAGVGAGIFIGTRNLPFFQGPSTGLSLFTAGVILSIMILPTITSISREVFEAIPNVYRESARALGATSWETIQLSVLKASRAGVVGAIMLGLGRALGETMAVTMVIGNNPQVSLNLLAAGHSMASVIANEFTEANGEIYLAALSEIGLLLMAITLILNIVAHLLVWASTRKFGRV